MLERIEKLVIVGVGLIGGSFALDLRRAGLVGRVTGVGRSAENLQRALQLKVIDEASHDLANTVTDADLILIATPVGQMAGVMQQINGRLKAGAIVTDAGSTKTDVVDLYHRYLGMHLSQCVPAHPIAGSDLSGASAARFSLFESRKVVLTPLAETDAASIAKVSALWMHIGAQVVQMNARTHDDVFATVSHLPHLLAFAYMNHVLDRRHADDCLALAASGFRDFTRIAGGHPEMWRDIAIGNRNALLDELRAFRHHLDETIDMLEHEDAAALGNSFDRASKVRSRWKM